MDLRLMAALLLSCHLTGTGTVSRIVSLSECRAYLSGKKALRIGLASGARDVRLSCSRPAQIEVGGESSPWRSGVLQVHCYGGRLALDAAGRDVWTDKVAVKPASAAAIRVVSDGTPAVDGDFRGGVEIIAAGDGAVVVNLVGLEDYLKGVVPAEMPASFPMEALKAQAIAARTYALYQREAHQSEGFDLCSGVHCQVYRGAQDRARTNAAIRATAGKVVAFGDALVKTVYHSTCGGSTDDGWRVWWGHALPYLRARSDGAWCSASAKYRWSRQVPWPDAARAVEDNLASVCFKPGASAGPLSDLRVQGRTPGGRAQWLSVVGAEGEQRVRGDWIRWLFGSGKPGPGGLNSAFFTLSIERDQQGSPARAVFSGRGWGHGLGMCQMGAAGRARAGQKAESILRWYYQGARVATVR